MEIRVERRLTGREYRDEILTRYGSREELEERARGGDALARDDLADLRLLEETPERLDAEYEVETVAYLGGDDLARLTPTRLRLLATLQRSREAGDELNVTDLASELGRDKKNVSEDLHLLEDLGFLDLVERGREKVARPLGDEIHIVLDQRGNAGPGSARADAAA